MILIKHINKLIRCSETGFATFPTHIRIIESITTNKLYVEVSYEYKRNNNLQSNKYW